MRRRRPGVDCELIEVLLLLLVQRLMIVRRRAVVLLLVLVRLGMLVLIVVMMILVRGGRVEPIQRVAREGRAQLLVAQILELELLEGQFFGVEPPELVVMTEVGARVHGRQQVMMMVVVVVVVAMAVAVAVMEVVVEVMVMRMMLVVVVVVALGAQINREVAGCGHFGALVCCLVMLAGEEDSPLAAARICLGLSLIAQLAQQKLDGRKLADKLADSGRKRERKKESRGWDYIG